MFLRCFSFFSLFGYWFCIVLAHPLSCCLSHTFSNLPGFLWSCLILYCRQKTLTWPCWPASLWLFLTLLYAGGYPFVHRRSFPCVIPLWPSPPLLEPKPHISSYYIQCSYYHIYLDHDKHFCQPGTDHQNSEVKKKSCQVISLQTLY